MCDYDRPRTPGSLMSHDFVGDGPIRDFDITFPTQRQPSIVEPVTQVLRRANFQYGGCPTRQTRNKYHSKPRPTGGQAPPSANKGSYTISTT